MVVGAADVLMVVALVVAGLVDVSAALDVGGCVAASVVAGLDAVATVVAGLEAVAPVTGEFVVPGTVVAAVGVLGGVVALNVVVSGGADDVALSGIELGSLASPASERTAKDSTSIAMAAGEYNDLPLRDAGTTTISQDQKDRCLAGCYFCLFPLSPKKKHKKGGLTGFEMEPANSIQKVFVNHRVPQEFLYGLLPLAPSPTEREF